MAVYPEDPRYYIRHEYEQRHARNPSYSWRSFARDLKMSPSMLSEFLKGRYGLSRVKATQVAQAIRLDEDHTCHFIDLLESLFHRGVRQRKMARMRIAERLQSSSERHPSSSPLRNWIHFAILEALGLERSALKEEGWIEAFRPERRTTEHAVVELIQHGFITDNGEGLFPSDSLTLAEECPETLNSIHIQVLDLAKKAITALPADQRESLSIFASIRARDLSALRRELNDSFTQILNRYACEPEADTVYGFSLEAFPVYTKSGTRQ